MLKPRSHPDQLYRLLLDGKVQLFNERRGPVVDLTDCNLRGVDLRGLDARGVDLSGCYLRQADLRGVDLSQATLHGTSLNGARISGVLFPEALSAEEIRLSVSHGTRMRYPRDPGTQGRNR